VNAGAAIMRPFFFGLIRSRLGVGMRPRVGTR